MTDKRDLLKWSEEQQPSADCRYNHVTAETPFGRFLITWKGWRQYPSYDLDEAPFDHGYYVGGSLEEVKKEAQRLYSEALRSAQGVKGYRGQSE